MMRAVAPLRNTGCNEVDILIHLYTVGSILKQSTERRGSMLTVGVDSGGASGDKLKAEPRAGKLFDC